MPGDGAKLAAMQQFVRASGSNLETALLIHRVMPDVITGLICEFLKHISELLLERAPDWCISDNSFMENPNQRWTSLTWGPKHWRGYQWGLSLSPDRSGTRRMFFGLVAPSTTIEDRFGIPAMSDRDRKTLANILRPTLLPLSQQVGEDEWYPVSAYLPGEVIDWQEPGTLNEIARALGIVEKSNLIGGWKLDEFLVDVFMNAKEAIGPVIDKQSIQPVPD